MDAIESSIRATYLATEYRHNATGWGVYLLKADNDAPLVACGCLKQPPIVGETITATGVWSRFKSKGQVFEFSHLRAVAPRNPDFFVDYLAAIGEIPSAAARMIVEAFGRDTLLVLSRSPERLAEVQEISPNHIERLTMNWRDHRQQDHLEDELDKSGLNPDLLLELSYRLPPELTVQDMLSSDPWLIYLYSKTPFYLVKDFVISTGAIESGHFLEAAVIAVARRALMQGNRSVSKADISHQAPNILGLKTTYTKDQISTAISWLVDEGLVLEKTDGTISLTEHSDNHRLIQERIMTLLDAENEITDQLTLSQVTKVLKSDQTTRFLLPKAEKLLKQLQQKVLLVHACHPTIATIFETIIENLSAKLFFDLVCIHSNFVQASKLGKTSLNILGRSRFGPPEKGSHDPLDADVVVIFDSHILSTEDLKDALFACEDAAVVMLVGNLYSSPLHVPGSPLPELKAHLDVLNLDDIVSELEAKNIREILALSKGEWTPPADTADIDFNSALIPIECPNNEIESVVRSLCFGELIGALNLDPGQDTQIIIPRPTNRETVDLLKDVEASYAKCLTEHLGQPAAYRGMLRAPVSRLNLPIYLTGQVQTGSDGSTTFIAGSDLHCLYPNESKFVGVAYLAQIAQAQQIRKDLIVVILPSGESMTNEELLCAMACSDAWTFLVGSPDNVKSVDLEASHGL